MGSEWIDSRAHELVVTGAVRTDAQAFTDAGRALFALLELWRAADPEFQPLVDSVRRRMDRLKRAD